MQFVKDLDTPLLRLSPSDKFCLRDAFQGVHVLGSPGSGKTSSTGMTLATAYLRAGMGGVVLCAKPEEVGYWIDLATKNGRKESVIVFDEQQGFNFIDYELARQGLNGISNVTECLMRVLTAADHATGSGANEDAFWTQTARQLLNYTIPVLYCTYGSLSVTTIIDFVMTAATTAANYKDDKWCAQSFAAATLAKFTNAPAIPLNDEHASSSLWSYWINQFPAIPEKTRGNILISLSTKLDRFRHGRLRNAFSGRTTIVPEMTFHGAIIIMAMPVMTWNEDGVIGQQLFKFMWQRAMDSRNDLEPVHRERAVFLWADEAQYFVALKDEEFLSTCRASRACVVFLTQTLPTYYARLGKNQTDAADGLVGKFSTQVFHQNACNRTNKFASELIGRAIHHRGNASRNVGSNTNRGMNQGSNSSYGASSSSGGGSSGNSVSSNWSSGSSSSSGNSWGDNVGRGQSEGQSWGTSEQMDYLVEPNYFASELLSGGPKHGNKVTAVWVKIGGRFQDTGGRHFLFPTFQQSR